MPQLGPLRNRAEKSDTFTDLLGLLYEGCLKAHMKKTDIAELVTDALKTESKHFRKSELQCIRAVNNGQHGELKPLPKPKAANLSSA